MPDARLLSLNAFPDFAWHTLRLPGILQRIALFSGGVALLFFAALYYVLDVRRWRAGTTPFRVFGTNAIFAFALSTVITALAARPYSSVSGAGKTSLHLWAYHHVFAPVLPSRPASLAYAGVIVLLNLALVYPLYRKRIFLRL